MTDSAIAFLPSEGGLRLAYRRREGRGPAIVFLPGYASDMDGTKALALDAFASQRGSGCCGSTIRAPARPAAPSRTARSTLARGNAGDGRPADRRSADPGRIVDGRRGSRSTSRSTGRSGSRRWSGSRPRPTSPNGASPAKQAIERDAFERPTAAPSPPARFLAVGPGAAAARRPDRDRLPGAAGPRRCRPRCAAGRSRPADGGCVQPMSSCIHKGRRPSPVGTA